MFALFIVGMIALTVVAGYGGWWLFGRVYSTPVAVTCGLVGLVISVSAFVMLINALLTGGHTYQRDIIVTSVVSKVDDGQKVVVIQGVKPEGRYKDGVTCTDTETVDWCADRKAGDTITLVTVNNDYGFSTTHPVIAQ